MSFSEVVRTWLPLVVAIDMVIVLPLLAVATVLALVRRPRHAGWLGSTATCAVGFALGFLVLVTDNRPALRIALLIAIPALTVATMFVGGRPGRGGILLLAAAMPWLVFDAAAVADVAFLGRRMTDPSAIVASLIVAAVTAVAGVSLIVFQHQWDGRHGRPAAAASVRPVERRWDVVGRLTVGTDPWWSPPMVGATVGLVLSTLLTGTIAHGRPPLEVVIVGAIGVVLSATVFAFGFALVRTPRSRRALEPYVWLSEREFERIATLTGSRTHATPRGVRRYVRNTPERPEDRWIRVDVLVASGNVAAARIVADRMPEDTPSERVARAGAEAWLRWLEGGTVDLDRLTAEVAAVEPVDGDDRLEAEIILAAAQVRVRAGDGVPDATAPLRMVGARLGPRAWRARIRFIERLSSQGLPLAAAMVVIVLFLDGVSAA